MYIYIWNRTHFTKCLVWNNLNIGLKLRLKVNFRKISKIYFGHNSKTNKDISKIPTDSSSAGQQLSDSKWKSVGKKVVYSTK